MASKAPSVDIVMTKAAEHFLTWWAVFTLICCACFSVNEALRNQGRPPNRLIGL